MGTMKRMPLAVACALAVMTVAPVEAQVQEFVIHNFTFATGWSPTPAGVTLAPDGIYGTTESGGTSDDGVVYKLDTAFHYTVLHNFTGVDGVGPNVGVIRDSAGNLYGTTRGGGTAGNGVLYKLDSAGSYTALYNFTGGMDGGGSFSGVILDSTGNIYGTAGSGGTAGYGVVYKLDASANYAVLYNFTGGADGGGPAGGVIRDSADNLYGATSYAINGGARVVYELDADDNYTVLHRFPERTFPSGVILAQDGLYGTTETGGTAGDGVVYKLDASAHYTVLYNFTGGADGGAPAGGVIRDSAGNLYGTTQGGGLGGCGVVYKLDSAGNYTVLYNFAGGVDGRIPQGGVVRTRAGNLIGTTSQGGSVDYGVVFVLTGVQ
jgi:uncharacterized repeat protein (TIGR03803 family)